MPDPNLYDPDCPTRLVLDRIGDRWTVLVVLLLSQKSPMRFTELRRHVGGIAPKVLTQTLRALERDGLLRRTVYAEVPPRVEYELTELGRSLRAPITAIGRWAERHVGEVLDARASYDDDQRADQVDA
ncbi:transcriptional regulator, HxlR family [Streptoalloteichus tenebrarius]|uniref:Transcriptional regulator, HxlR family n=1 Tax=Streptoalloteichus tenebrarius (strain ATCC 17920 / DSM 40477 / JCM 4838 / CBS 697.72 / NBRC 16177 / NCIMB 11028 / NRRL B-12390 / A12253. 1 / ISP 5477) TaxID=1933 RepID=A0ABT1HU23_STRSD|nr:helix-turn-helix domain-containing protein [Streptoalloteichus tenebrarius]MCP2259009.1 transcriptional regulator, HxlR family [Streptoalloteichus tenebrarius]BFF01222.1 helix-turn-helix domain-containing protein [Streptoalloteichus tenebrarius]